MLDTIMLDPLVTTTRGIHGVNGSGKSKSLYRYMKLLADKYKKEVNVLIIGCRREKMVNTNINFRLEELVSEGDIPIDELRQQCEAFCEVMNTKFNLKSKFTVENETPGDNNDLMEEDGRVNAPFYISGISSYEKLPSRNQSTLSHGIRQICHMVWYAYVRRFYPLVILVDEPENGLDIDNQRRIIPVLRDAPSCVGITAVTNSPMTFNKQRLGNYELVNVNDFKTYLEKEEAKLTESYCPK